MSMRTRISPENEQFIMFELEEGSYKSREELLDEAVGLLRRRRELQRDIRAGIESGPSIPARDVIRRLEKRARELVRRASKSVRIERVLHGARDADAFFR